MTKYIFFRQKTKADKEALIYSLDIGGSSVKHGIINLHNQESPLVEKFDPILLESRKFDNLKDSILESIKSTLTRFPFLKAVSISTTGAVDDDTGLVVNAGHFEDYRNVSWKELVQKEFRQIKKVFVTNDGKASAWAEFTSFRKKYDHFAHIVIGTGVGGAIIVNGRFLAGDGKQAGRIGHIKITDKETIRCSCGAFGCVETLASVPAIQFHYHQLTNLHELPSNEKPAFERIVELVQQDDQIAIESVKLAGFYLGKLVAVLMVLINPGTITLGGGVIEAFDNGTNIYLDSVEKSARLHAHKRVADFTVIKKAKYGNDGGLIGAAQLAFQA